MDIISRYVIDEDDVAYEYELQRTPQSTVTWRRYLDSWRSNDNNKRPDDHISWLYERFCDQFPDELDVWEEYIRWSLAICGDEVHYNLIFDLFQRCLMKFKGDCDSLCLLFLEFSISQYNLKMIRVALDTSLSKISRNTHARVWEMVLKFVYQTLLPLTEVDGAEYEDDIEKMSILIYKSLFGSAEDKEDKLEADIWSSRILKKYLQVCSRDKLEETLIHLAETRDYATVHAIYENVLAKGSQFLPDSKISYPIHLHFLTALENLRRLDEYESFIGAMRAIFPQKGVDLTKLLAKFYIKNSRYENVDDLLRESLEKTMTVDDFSAIYNFHLDYEKMFIETILEELKVNPHLQKDSNWGLRLEAHMSHLQDLTDLQKLKLNDLKIRQKPYLVSNWLERAALSGPVERQCDVYAKAILSIDPLKVTIPGSFGILWCEYAQLYWDAEDFEHAREVWDRSLRVPYPYVEDLENIWISWVEHELDETGLHRGIQLLETALKVPEAAELVLETFKTANKKIPAQTIVFSSLKLWSLYLDLAESLCSTSPDYVGKTISIYEQVITLKVATPLIFINYAHFLQDRKQILESFQIYERAIGIFPPETQFEIWNIYLAESTEENSPIPNEHIRDLFDQALENLVPNGIDCKSIFILYSNFEEQCGFSNRSVDILLQGCRNTSDLESKLTLWQLCISKVKELLSSEESRKFYEECIQSLPNSKAITFVTEFSMTEAALGEVERAREILKYGAQLLPPGRNGELWKSWDNFEIQYGDKESYKDMLKLKRRLETEMRVETELESQNAGNVEFVAASKTNAVNPEEIDLDI